MDGYHEQMNHHDFGGATRESCNVGNFLAPVVRPRAAFFLPTPKIAKAE